MAWRDLERAATAAAKYLRRRVPLVVAARYVLCNIVLRRHCTRQYIASIYLWKAVTATSVLRVLPGGVSCRSPPRTCRVFRILCEITSRVTSATWQCARENNSPADNVQERPVSVGPLSGGPMLIVELTYVALDLRKISLLDSVPSVLRNAYFENWN